MGHNDIDEMVLFREHCCRILFEAKIVVSFYTESIREVMEDAGETRYECENGTLVNLTPKGLRITPFESRIKKNWRTSTK